MFLSDKYLAVTLQTQAGTRVGLNVIYPLLLHGDF
jgi:hypothetical protein